MLPSLRRAALAVLLPFVLHCDGSDDPATAIRDAFAAYEDCGDRCYDPTVLDRLLPFPRITKAAFDRAKAHGSRLVHYQIVGGRLFRSAACNFKTRCYGLCVMMIR